MRFIVTQVFSMEMPREIALRTNLVVERIFMLVDPQTPVTRNNIDNQRRSPPIKSPFQGSLISPRTVKVSRQPDQKTWIIPERRVIDKIRGFKWLKKF